MNQPQSTGAALGYAVFDTAIGRCAVAWRGAAVVSVALPGATTTPTHAATDITVGPVRAAVEGMVSLLAGEPVDLREVCVDLRGVPEFDQEVYAQTRLIDPGSTVSYGQLAERMGRPGSAQAVGQALGRNPVPIIVPCHRVLAADGSLHGFSAAGGIETKRRMLLIEGAAAVAPTLF